MGQCFVRGRRLRRRDLAGSVLQPSSLHIQCTQDDLVPGRGLSCTKYSSEDFAKCNNDNYEEIRKQSRDINLKLDSINDTNRYLRSPEAEYADEACHGITELTISDVSDRGSLDDTVTHLTDCTQPRDTLSFNPTEKTTHGQGKYANCAESKVSSQDCCSLLESVSVSTQSAVKCTASNVICAYINESKHGFQNEVVTSTGTQTQIEPRTSLQKELQPLSRMKYLQKYCPSSTSVSMCDHKGRVVTSKDDAIKLTVPNGAIMDGDLVVFYFVTCLFGPFILPSCRQHDLASPYYWIGVSESYRFHKPIQVEFEHFAALTVACNPSHFQLLSCEDDDKSFTMRLADYALSFSVQDGRSWCTFQTDHFCSYCLFHGCNDSMVTKIGAFFLKPKNFKNADKFTVEVWFSFPISYCLKRNAELYTSKDMILDKDCSRVFDAASDKTSTSFFALNYDQCDDGWNVKQFRFEKILAEDINFYNYYVDMEDLKVIEDIGVFPPHFMLDVEKKPDSTNNLNREIRIALFKAENTTSTESASFKLFVPLSMPRPVKSSVKDFIAHTQHESHSTSIPLHRCEKNKPVLKDLMDYSTKISDDWRHIALLLGIPQHEVSTIDLNNPRIKQKCSDLFGYWLNRTPYACWCHFIQALYDVKLRAIAEEAKAHLKLSNIDEQNTVDLYQLVKFLSDIPDCDLNYFIKELLTLH